MSFVADLHVHSKFSRATSRDLDLPHLAQWAARKGIAVAGTGDCVHPGWLAEIKASLTADAGGLFRLKPEAATGDGVADVRFLLTTEISTIYKKDGRTRKVHHVVLLPSLTTAERFADRLARIGNIASDGRPILGLDSRDLLEIVLECDPDAYLIPAHIWTPWFSALGALSGFDSIAACYGDLADHIFAVETGLSSDPAMNWRVSSLDRYRLVSHSDAHSPAKLGREATLYDGAMDFFAIRRALETGAGYGGTLEFFPEEGKYHLDGHRACDVRLDPRQTQALDGRCPVCGKPVTIGVAHRVEALADRATPQPPPTAGAVTSLVPLSEILAELLGVGAGSQAVAAAYARTAALGPELTVLRDVPLADIARHETLLGEAIGRLRAGKTFRQGGYDGEYGVIRLFEPGELDRLTHGALLFAAPPTLRRKKPKAVVASVPEPEAVAAEPEVRPSSSGALAGLDADQCAAALTPGPLAVIAGPGSGKTRLIVHRLAHLVEAGAPADDCLAVTFTRRATAELQSRLQALLPQTAVAVHSFHSLGLAILRAEASDLPADFYVAGEGERAAALDEALGLSRAQAGKMVRRLSVLKRTKAVGTDAEELARQTLARLGKTQGWIDFDDLVIRAVRLLEAAPAARWRFAHVLIDEFQDIDPWQYRLAQAVTGPGGDVCVIGDPDQAIYGFRGADETCFDRFAVDHPTGKVLRLDRNYRSSGAIVAASAALMGRTGGTPVRAAGAAVELFAAADERAEAAFVAATIADLMGGHDMLTAGRRTGGAYGFGDFAVLYRTDAQAAPLRAALDEAGIPYQKSRPALLADHAGVAAVLAGLAAVPEGDLSARVTATVDAVDAVDAALLAEARGWLSALAGNCRDEADFRAQVALASEADFRDPLATRVSLLTMHAAKGLEFPVVFVVGVEEGLTPFAFPDDDDATHTDEERRLFYVALTRAQDRLILSHAQTRFWRGERRSLPASSFLRRLAVKTIRAKPRAPVQYRLF